MVLRKAKQPEHIHSGSLGDLFLLDKHVEAGFFSRKHGCQLGVAVLQVKPELPFLQKRALCNKLCVCVCRVLQGDARDRCAVNRFGRRGHRSTEHVVDANEHL